MNWLIILLSAMFGGKSSGQDEQDIEALSLFKAQEILDEMRDARYERDIDQIALEIERDRP